MPTLALIILLGTCLRGLWLDWQPIWWDEGYSIYFATESIPQMLALTALDIHPPLYYALLHIWSALTGRTDPATLRLLSVIIGALALPIFAWLAHLLFRSRARTLTATLLLAVSPMHLFYSQELRMYGLAMLLGLVATICLWILIEEPSTRTILGYALAIGLTLYTIYYSAFLILAHAIWALWRLRSDLKKCKPFVIAYCIAALLYLPWIIYAATNLFRYVGEKIGFDNDTPLTPLHYLWRHLLAFTAGHLPNNNRVLFFLSIVGIMGLILLIERAILQRVGPMNSPTILGKSEPSTGSTSLAARPAIWCWFAIPVVIGFLLNLRLPFFPDGGERLLLFVLPYFLLLVADGIVSCFGNGRLAGGENVLPHPSPLQTAALGVGTVTGQPILTKVEQDDVPQISPLPVWGGLGWGGKIDRSRVNANRAIGTIALLSLLLSAGVGIYNFYTIDRYAERDYRTVIKQIVQQGSEGDTLLAIFPWQVGYWRAYAPAELRSQEPLLLGQSSLEWTDAIRTQIDDALARGGTLWFPAPLSLGSDLPLEIETYLQQQAAVASSPAELSPSEMVEASDEATANEQTLLNLETRWVNATTRVSAWRLVPEFELSAALPDGTLFADFGELHLLSAAISPGEVASANSVIHAATEWVVEVSSLAELSRSETVEANDETSIDWQFTLRLLDEYGHSWAERTYRSTMAERWRSDIGFVVPVGVPAGQYVMAIGVDRVDVKTDGEEAVSLSARVPENPQESTEFVRLGNLVITQPTEPMAPYRLSIDRVAAPPITDDGLTLLGVSGVDPKKSALAGTRMSLDIFLQNQSATPPLRSLYVSLLDDDGAGMAGGEFEYPTEQLVAGALAQVPVEVDLPATLASGAYRLIAGFVDPVTGAKSPAAELGLAASVVQRLAVFDAPTMTNVLPSPARFGSHVDLLGYDIVVDEQISLMLYWRAEQSLLPQHNIFVHLVDDDGAEPLAQWDGVPQGVGAGGELILAPTGSWRTGEFLATQHLLPLVDGIDGLALKVGLYLPETGARLPVAVDGVVVGDFVRIDFMQVDFMQVDSALK